MKYPLKIILMAVLWLSTSTAFAAMVSTPHLIAEPERAQLVRNIAERQHVEQQLIELGVDPIDASDRVKQMTDQQISSLQGKITELPAGAGVSTTNLLLIVIVLILLL
jgi:TolA-binding protein